MHTHHTFTKTELEAIAKSMVERLIRLSCNWQLTSAELAALLGHDEGELQALINKPELIAAAISGDNADTWLPIVELLKIKSLLDVLISKHDGAVPWIKTPNTAPLFGGATALEFLLRDPANNRSLVIGYLWGVGNCNFS